MKRKAFLYQKLSFYSFPRARLVVLSSADCELHLVPLHKKQVLTVEQRVGE